MANDDDEIMTMNLDNARRNFRARPKVCESLRHLRHKRDNTRLLKKLNRCAAEIISLPNTLKEMGE